MRTNENGRQYEHSLDHHLEFFSKAGSAFTNRKVFYGNPESALSLFQKAWIVEKELAMRLLFWLRDCRGGAGNRSGFRECITWLASFDPAWVKANIHLIPEFGRWDDLRSLFSTVLAKDAGKLWADAIKDKNILAAKWADRKDIFIAYNLRTNEAGLRKTLSSIRKSNIVEHAMCQNMWNTVEYKHVPSVAMARYANAFSRHDEDRFLEYKESIKSGTTTINAAALFPHDCVRTVRHGDKEIANAQFDSLPNYLEDVDERIIVLSDTSGSMCVPISGSIHAVDISQGLALYCSAKMPKDSPFYKKFIGFCSEGSFKDWTGMTFSQAVNSRRIFDGAIGSTYIDRALDLILKTAKFFNIPDEKMPTALLIVSDMQFHQGASCGETEVKAALSRWSEAGYSIPKVIYWNLNPYSGSPETIQGKNVALVSGFSPAILKSIFAGVDLSPKAVMLRAIEKYKVNIPN